MMAICAGFPRTAPRPNLPPPPLAHRPRSSGTSACHLYRLLLETDARPTIHLARKPRLRQPGPALVSVRGRRVAQGTLPHVGSFRMGRPLPDRPGATRRRLSAQLDPLPVAPAQRLDPPGLRALVLR